MTTSSRTDVWRPAMAALMLGFVLWLPGNGRAIPAELPAVLLLAALPPLRLPLLGILVLTLLLKAGDAGLQGAFGRPFNLVTDWQLLGAAWQLGRGSLGLWRMMLGVGAAILLLGVLTLGIRWSLRQRRGGWAGLAILAVFAILPPQAATTRMLADKALTTRATLADLAAFRRAAATDPFAGQDGLLAALRGRDTAIIFVESYGRTSFAVPDNAAHPQLLHRAEARLAGAGLAMRSGWLTSPVMGGQSWLAHATLSAGLPITDQGRYGALLASPRRTLFHLASEAGLHTAAFTPQTTEAWPEGTMLGFREIRDAAHLGYAGRALNWVTMPDQYVLSVLERRMRVLGPPLFAEVDLASSHAPWVPVIGMRDWDTIGDGRGFDGTGWDRRTPREVWADPDTVRAQYSAAILYSLQAVTEFVERQAGSGMLAVILGDHQPAGFVAQMDNRDVPVHMIGPPDLIRRIDGWGWTPGLVPAADLPALPMDGFRDRFLNAFGAADTGG
ncbi:sulfatase [Falsirhodobacter algicola]|uniref:Sulfatase n=2 Tax=Falsirhodobacter algicola TaxID=2692330 RepID=A0A8J8MV21_9RHOB|nr:sulfatase [Falsirhodobacter algicola]